MRKFVLILGLVMMMGAVAAHGFDYKEKYTETRYSDGLKIVSKSELLVNYENDNRYSTSDYRHGYSYRVTKDYFSDKYDIKHNDRKKHMNCDDHGSGTYNNALSKGRTSVSSPSSKKTYYEYVHYLGESKERKCYVSPPADKLFYIKC